MSGPTSSFPPPLRASAFHPPHALVEDNVYTVVKRDITDPRRFPLLPRDAMAPVTSAHSVTFTLNWIPNEHPFMFLVPLYPPFYGPLFDRLNINERNVPIIRVGSLYTLSEELKTEWISLERNLRAILFALADLYRASLPSPFYYLPYPDRYGYRHSYHSARLARLVAIRSRDAFVPLMAAVTFFLIIVNELENVVNGFTWRDRVLAKTGIHYHWLSMLEESAVGDLSIDRIGGIIDMQKCQYKPLIHLIAKARLDMYICWGRIDSEPERPLGYLMERGLVPNHKDIHYLYYLAKHPPPPPSPPPNTSVLQSVQAHEHHEMRKFPPVERYSHQKEGESWQAFFARRDAKNKERLIYETSKQRQSRLAKEKYAEQHVVPGRKGARVFRWEDVDGFRIRRAVGRNKYELWWSDYSDGQRRYDSWHDEWDLCTEFGEPDDASDDEFELLEPLDQLNNMLFEDEVQLLPDTQTEPDHHEGNYSSRADLQRVHNQESTGQITNSAVPDEDQPLNVFIEGFDDTLYYRFGFSPIADVEPPSRHISWELASQVLGSGRWMNDQTHTPTPSQNIQADICEFLGYLWLSRDMYSLPRQILDVRQEESDVWKSPRKLWIRETNLNGTQYYFIRSGNYTQPELAPMELGVTSAATVLEVIRRQLGPGLDSVAEFLMDKGASFNTFIRGSQQPPAPAVSSKFPGLGYRPPGYHPDTIDYEAYVATLNQFLRTSRCRAALMAGGLIARIAKNVVPYSEVLHGPSDFVLEEGLCLWDGKSHSPGYWDDKLTRDEEDMICGVYKIATGQRDSNGCMQTSDISWWPKPAIWAGSGLNIGYWSEDCEKWYQNHLKMCISGTAKLRNPKDWRHALRFTKDVGRLVERNELRASEQFKIL